MTASKKSSFIVDRSKIRDAVERSMDSYQFGTFKKNLALLPFDDFFSEPKDSNELSLWHNMIYEGLPLPFVQEVFDWAQRQNKSVPIDLPLHINKFNQGRSAYLIAVAFGMLDTMDFLIEKGANPTFSFTQKNKVHNAKTIAEEFFGENSNSPDEEIIEMVNEYWVAFEQKILNEEVSSRLSNKKSIVKKSKI